MAKQNDYNKLTHEEVNKIREQISNSMRTTNGDTAPITITARQAAILLFNFIYQSKPKSDDDVFSELG